MKQDDNFVLTCWAYLVSMLLLMMIHIAMGLGWLNGLSDEVLEVGFSIASQIVVMLVVPFLIFYFAKRKRAERGNGSVWTQTSDSQLVMEPQSGVLKDLGFNKISGKFILLSFVLGVLLYLMNMFVAGFFSQILDGMGYQPNFGDNVFNGVWGLVISLILGAVLPGVCEEFLHRGVLLSGFVKKFGVYRAVLFASLLFGMMHMNVYQFFYTTVMGWFVCIAVLASRSIWVGIIIHFVNNGISAYLSYAEELALPGSEVLMTLLSNSFLTILVLILVIVGVGEIIRYMGRVNFEKNKGTYTAKYLAAHTDKFTSDDFERVQTALDTTIKSMSTWRAVFAYIETHEKPKPMTPLERTLFTSLLVLGGIITTFSLYWGVL